MFYFDIDLAEICGSVYKLCQISSDLMTKYRNLHYFNIKSFKVKSKDVFD